ncbi:hypothetical protein IP88_09305 [alpha proteobacterium AAP81b]|nr:hypothetical protein IP88_09305 [alpha proteobacterium AAP81b]
MIPILLALAPGFLGYFESNKVGAPIAGLAPGKTVTLAAGDTGPLAIMGQRFDPPVTIDARVARVRGLRIWKSSGIIWKNGNLVAEGGTAGASFAGYCVNVRESTRIAFENIACSGAARAIVVSDSRAITVRRSVFTGLRIDGINIAGSSDVLVEGNRFTDFTPVKATGSKADGTWKDGDHPDAIQLWTTKTNPRMTDIIIRDNVIEGETQGINFFGPRGQGYARVVVTGNTINIAYPAAISLIDCEDCTVVGNKAAKLPGAKFKANVRLVESAGRFCGNVITDVPAHIANAPCPRQGPDKVK